MRFLFKREIEGNDEKTLVGLSVVFCMTELMNTSLQSSVIYFLIRARVIVIEGDDNEE